MVPENENENANENDAMHNVGSGSDLSSSLPEKRTATKLSVTSHSMLSLCVAVDASVRFIRH